MADTHIPVTEQKRRGAGTGPRKYTLWEWTRGYLAWLLVFPLYLALWGFAALCPRLPAWAVRKLLRNHNATTSSRGRDVRIPGTPTIPAYMLRWWKIKRNWAFNCYYHIVKRSDEDLALHDHPWWNFSIVLEGGYWEHLILAGGVHKKTWYGPGAVRFRRSGNFAHRLELQREQVINQRLVDKAYVGDGQYISFPYHMASYEERPVKTIFITGPVLRRWGFHHPERWVDAYEWDDFCDERGISTMKMAGYAEQLKKD